MILYATCDVDRAKKVLSGRLKHFLKLIIVYTYGQSFGGVGSSKVLKTIIMMMLVPQQDVSEGGSCRPLFVPLAVGPVAF